MTRLARFSRLTLGLNVLVILWGAFVRASKSGDGCGSHWPLCNGDVVPNASMMTTVVEFTHRLTSGLALILVVVLLVRVWRNLAKGHPARGGAVASLVFILIEALIGAVLVRKGLVANNDSMARAFVMSLHLVNTFLLLGSLTLTVWWLTTDKPLRLAGQGVWLLAALGGAAGLIILGVSGAVAALGDTLFPSRSLAEALRQDLSGTAHILLRLRIFHPFIAAGVGTFLLCFAGAAMSWRDNRATKILGLFLSGLVLTQLFAGLVNVALLAPVWLQLFHLFLADVIWIVFVLLSAAILAQEQTAGAVVPRASLRPA
jgi:heme A synthase